MLSNGHKGKFNQYGMDLFLIGKSRKDFIAKKIYERKVELGIIDEKIRILEAYTNSASGNQEQDTGFDWSSFLDELKFFLYLVSWVNLVIGKILIWKASNNMNISERLVKYISISQKVHFCLFNFVCIDVAFIGTRTLLHAQVSLNNRFLLLLTGFVFILLTVDLIEIAKL